MSVTCQTAVTHPRPALKATPLDPVQMYNVINYKRIHFIRPHEGSARKLGKFIALLVQQLTSISRNWDVAEEVLLNIVNLLSFALGLLE